MKLLLLSGADINAQDKVIVVFLGRILLFFCQVYFTGKESVL